ncbi:MAG: adenylate/guanylate cyclase domain-containing protein [Gemmatimonadota bacterium]|nr:adenylate/guanylate cyclase domain-containing protein [Gemmatimonadota bacterium]
MNIEHFSEMLLDSARVGLAIVRGEDLRIAFHNARFEEWFPNATREGIRVDELFEIDTDRLRKRIERGRPYTKETETKVGRRPISVALTFSTYEEGDADHLILECQNVSKLKELEYMIESYSKMIERQNRKLKRENERAEKLLLNIMPKKVYEEIQEFGVTTPERFEAASILMLDFVGFTEMAAVQDPATLVSELNDIFTAFDQIVEQFGCERIKTIGDAYMAVSGVPEPTPDHAQNIAKVALLLRRYVERRTSAVTGKWECRIGLSSGPVIGSIVGIHKYVYDIFGPAVNMASRLEAQSDAMEITADETLYDLIRSDFRFEEIGEREIKGLGAHRLYRLTGEGKQSARPSGGVRPRAD